jgi:hypothetical protein
MIYKKKNKTIEIYKLNQNETFETKNLNISQKILIQNLIQNINNFSEFSILKLNFLVEQSPKKKKLRRFNNIILLRYFRILRWYGGKRLIQIMKGKDEENKKNYNEIVPSIRFKKI